MSYIEQVQTYNSLLDSKLGRVGYYYSKKGHRLATKLLQWQQEAEKQSFKESYIASYKKLLG